MAVATPDDVREILEGYQIDSSTLSDSWIQKRIDRRVVPMVEEKVGFKLEGGDQQELVEHHSGTNEAVLMLDNRNATELVRVELLGTSPTTIAQEYQLIPGEGLLRAVNSEHFLNDTTAFPRGTRNIRVTIKVGFATCPPQITELVSLYAADASLANLQGRDGGGRSKSVVAFSQSYGEQGKFTEARQHILGDAHTILRRFTSAVVGQSGHE